MQNISSGAPISISFYCLALILMPMHEFENAVSWNTWLYIILKKWQLYVQHNYCLACWCSTAGSLHISLDVSSFIRNYKWQVSVVVDENTHSNVHQNAHLIESNIVLIDIRIPPFIQSLPSTATSSLFFQIESKLLRTEHKNIQDSNNIHIVYWIPDGPGR